MTLCFRLLISEFGHFLWMSRIIPGLDVHKSMKTDECHVMMRNTKSYLLAVRPAGRPYKLPSRCHVENEFS